MERLAIGGHGGVLRRRRSAGASRVSRAVRRVQDVAVDLAASLHGGDVLADPVQQDEGDCGLEDADLFPMSRTMPRRKCN
jgi:hypothetical protein